MPAKCEYKNCNIFRPIFDNLDGRFSQGFNNILVYVYFYKTICTQLSHSKR